MDKSLTRYYNETKQVVESLEQKPSRSKAEELYYYHVDRVRDFQHERLIHLIVTLFFSSLLMMSIVGLLWVASIDISPALLLIGLFGGAGIIIFITVLFYVRHYYRLENGVQRLYQLTERLRELIR